MELGDISGANPLATNLVPIAEREQWSASGSQGPKSRSMAPSVPRYQGTEQSLAGKHQRVRALDLGDKGVQVANAAFAR